MPFPTHLLTDVCLISRLIGRESDAFATPIYGPWTPTKCAHQQAFQKVRDSDGNERVSSSNLVTRERIELEDRVVLPVENGVAPPIPAGTPDEQAAVSPITFRNDRHRRAGYRLHQSFF
jgi:hypothetical protein